MRDFEKIVGALAIALAFFLVACGTPIADADDHTKGERAYLVIGMRDKMRSRNPLPAIAGDIWTTDVLDRVYDTVGKSLRETQELVPYILKGIDADDDGVFETGEYGLFSKSEGSDQLNVTAYYDFNGVYFHDGAQATVADLFFSYQLRAMNPRTSLNVLALMDKAGGAGSNYSASRWLFVFPAAKDWQNEPAGGDPSLRVAVKFRLQEPFFNFYRSTLSDLRLYPRHVWEGVGWRMNGTTEVSPLHEDFGIAIFPENDTKFGQGLPTTDPWHFIYLNSATIEPDSAEEWQPADKDVIGTGPFTFDFSDPVNGFARVLVNPMYFSGSDPKTGVVVDPHVAAYVHVPYIGGIEFEIYQSTTVCLIAVQKGDADFCHWSLAPAYIPGITYNPNIRVWTNPTPGFGYLGYNMRDMGLGNYHYGQPDQLDLGYHFRKAVAHLINRRETVRVILQNYGEIGTVPVSPVNQRFFNTSLTGYSLSEDSTRVEIDLAHNDALALVTQIPDAVNWFTWQNGKLYMPGKGTNPIEMYYVAAEISYPEMPYSCTVIAEDLRKFGIQIELKPTTPANLIDVVSSHLFDMYCAGWKLESWDPDYLYDFFHSSNSAAGRNYVGFNDPLSDAVLAQSRREMNETNRVALIKWEEAILLDKLPYDTLYFPMNIEAPRNNPFSGWLVDTGSVFNYWSLLNLRQVGEPPFNVKLSVGLTAPLAMAARSETEIIVTVTDQDGAPFEGADVTLTLAPHVAGNFTGINPPNSSISGKSHRGLFSATYQAPNVTYLQNVTITASVSFVYAPDAGRSTIITVYPSAQPYLVTSLVSLDSDVVASSENLRFLITVRTDLGLYLDDALVNLTLSPAATIGNSITPMNGNASSMHEVVYNAPRASELGTDETVFVLSATATYPGYISGATSTGFVVVKTYRNCPDGNRIANDLECPAQNLFAPTVLALLALGVTVVAVLAVVVLALKRRKRET